MTILVQATSVGKVYDGVPALRGVSIAGHAGSIHAVTGENGAGKSTLMKIIAGVVKPTEGVLSVRGKVVTLRSPLDALKLGISTVFQEFSLVPNLTVAETMFLGTEPRNRLGFLDRGEMARRAAKALAQVGLEIDPGRSVDSLSVAEQQSVEIAKGLSANADVFILDEPTAALSQTEVVRLEQLLKTMKEQGKCVFYISHRMREIFELCDTATVLKDGQLVGTYPTSELTQDSLLKLMVGRDVEQLYPPRAGAQEGPEVFRAEGIRIRPDREPVDIRLTSGRITALAGLEGQGQREIMRALAGVEHGAGAIHVTRDGSTKSYAPRNGSAHALGRGVAFMPEDRKSEGLYLDLSIDQNLSLGLHQRRFALQPARRFRDILDRIGKRLRIRAATNAMPVISLSGGNQQKVMLGRWLAVDAAVLLIEEPTRGVDVGAKAEIYGALREFCDAGGTVLFTSRELPEVIGLADQILVVNDFRIVAQREAANSDEQDIIRSAVR